MCMCVRVSVSFQCSSSFRGGGAKGFELLECVRGAVCFFFYVYVYVLSGERESTWREREREKGFERSSAVNGVRSCRCSVVTSIKGILLIFIIMIEFDILLLEQLPLYKYFNEISFFFSSLPLITLLSRLSLTCTTSFRMIIFNYDIMK